MEKVCSVDGCGPAKRLIQGMCSKHYQRLRNHGSVKPPGLQERSPNPAICIYPGCHGKPKAKGYCQRHYVRLTKHGDAASLSPAHGHQSVSSQKLFRLRKGHVEKEEQCRTLFSRMQEQRSEQAGVHRWKG